MNIILKRFDYADLFKEKLQCELDRVEWISGGRNSKIFKVIGSDNRRFVAKLYYRDKSDRRDRLGTEFTALSFLWQNNVKNVPRPVFAESIRGIAVYEYIDGNTIQSSEITLQDINEAVKFLLKLNQLKTIPDAAELPPASEAVFSLQALIENIQYRFDRLTALPKDGGLVSKCHQFLAEDIRPFFNYLKKWSKDKFLSSGHDDHSILPESERTLSPSDFGFHNALRRLDGKLVFIDFEYFGWDDPAKMIVDFILHPGMNLQKEFKKNFIEKMLVNFNEGKKLTDRLAAVYPLFGLKWCFILLNEFIPADLARRDFSKILPDNHEKKKALQLKKAIRMFREVVCNYERMFDLH
ncbi:phosphotransferase [Thermodesulfobacteriota bacterium]